MGPRRSALFVALFFCAVAASLAPLKPLWLDEILQLMESRQPSAIQMISELPQTAGAVPLGYLVQQAGLRITGYSAARARLTPVLFASASSYLVVLVAAGLGLRRPWIAGVVFLAFPLTLRYATESRVYSQALFFTVLATHLHLELAIRPTSKLAAACSLALIAAIYTYPYAGCIGLALVLWSTLNHQKGSLPSAIALLVAGLAFLPWFLWAKGGWAAALSQSDFHVKLSAATLHDRSGIRRCRLLGHHLSAALMRYLHSEALGPFRSHQSVRINCLHRSHLRNGR